VNKPFIWAVKSTPAVGFPHGAPRMWKVSRVVHSLFKDTHMRKIIFAAAVAGAALSLAACSKTEEAASSVDSAASEVASAADSAASVADSAATEAASAASSN
jgi:hypothetical protein